MSCRPGESGTDVLVAECDVTDPAQVEAMVAAAVHRFGGWTSWSTTPERSRTRAPMAERVPHELFEHTVKVDLLGAWYCCREAGAHMLRRGRGSIVNVSSATGLLGSAHFAPPTRRRRPQPSISPSPGPIGAYG